LIVAKGITAHRSAPKADRLGIEEWPVPESAIFLRRYNLSRLSPSGLTTPDHRLIEDTP
jgi:hypothetical protein